MSDVPSDVPSEVPSDAASSDAASDAAASDSPSRLPADASGPATAAYARVYEAEHPRLVAYARSLTGNAWVADDLVAEAHFRVWRRLAAGHAIENVPAYLMTTVRHLAVSVGRAAERETPRDPQAADAVETVDVTADSDGDPAAACPPSTC